MALQQFRQPRDGHRLPVEIPVLLVVLKVDHVVVDRVARAEDKLEVLVEADFLLQSCLRNLIKMGMGN